MKKKVEIEGVGPPRRDPRRNSVQDAGLDVKNGGMATHLVTNWADLESVGVPGLARTPLAWPGQKPVTLGLAWPEASSQYLGPQDGAWASEIMQNSAE